MRVPDEVIGLEQDARRCSPVCVLRRTRRSAKTCPSASVGQADASRPDAMVSMGVMHEAHAHGGYPSVIGNHLPFTAAAFRLSVRNPPSLVPQRVQGCTRRNGHSPEDSAGNPKLTLRSTGVGLALRHAVNVRGAGLATAGAVTTVGSRDVANACQWCHRHARVTGTGPRAVPLAALALPAAMTAPGLTAKMFRLPTWLPPVERSRRCPPTGPRCSCSRCRRLSAYRIPARARSRCTPTRGRGGLHPLSESDTRELDSGDPVTRI